MRVYFTLAGYHFNFDDIPAEVRSKAIGTLIDNYFVDNSVIQAGYPLDMRYAGPREALIHALFRQNYGSLTDKMSGHSAK